MDQSLFKYAENEIPRYTSYPTARQFSNDMRHDDYVGWLSELDVQKPISLYVHVPFCHLLCWYCGCHTTIVHGYDRISDYFSLLQKELNLLSRHLPDKLSVSNIHFGGGTPTILNERDLQAFMARIREVFRFEEDAEIAIEIDPRTLSHEKMKTLAACGFNRVSFGIQDFNLHVQEKINRIQSVELVAEKMGWLREAGINEINFDLMYGLPTQSLTDLEKTIDASLALNPSRFAVFGYAHVPWFKKHQEVIRDEDLPGTVERVDQAKFVSEYLTSSGYQAIGFDHFAKPEDALSIAAHHGQLKRNFQGYTTDSAETMLALGPSSIGMFSHAYMQNAPRMDEYREALEKDELPIVRGLRVNKDDQVRRAAIERLLCDFEVDTQKISQQFGFADNYLDDAFDRLADMQKDGLVEIKGHKIKATPTGRLFIRNIATSFDIYHKPTQNSHSRAI